jgi:serine/threonine protein kinase
VTSLSDGTLDHLRQVADWPDLSATRYEIVEPIAQGGMGTVYLANDRHLRRPVALKVLHAPASGPEAGERMLREARIIARLEHPGIVPVHDVGTLPDGRIFYAMKRVAGERLDRHLRAGLSLSGRLRLFERICEAVAFAHAHGVVHRDLKPENVMVGAFGEVLVLDWGRPSSDPIPPLGSWARPPPPVEQSFPARPRTAPSWARRATCPPSRRAGTLRASMSGRTCTPWEPSCISSSWDTRPAVPPTLTPSAPPRPGHKGGRRGPDSSSPRGEPTPVYRGRSRPFA